MKKFLFAGLSCLAASPSTMADPADYVVSIYDNENLKKIDLRFGAERVSDQPDASAATIGYGFAVKRWWFTELYGKFERSDDEATKFDAFYWANSFLLTSGESMFDLGLHADIERPQDRSEGTSLRIGPVLRTDFGKIQLQTNLFFSRSFGAETPNATQLSYQWQATHKIQPQLELGLHGFGELGDWNHWAPRDQQAHRVGPVIAGVYRFSERQALRYEAGLLFGKVEDHRSQTLHASLAYEF